MSGQDSRPSAEAIVEQHWPYDGPHSEIELESAASAIGELFRHMANALWTVKPSGPCLYRVLSRLNAANYGLDEVLDHLRDAAENLAGDSSMYDDRRDRPAAQTAHEVLEHISQARRDLVPGRQAVEKAAGAACHLGHESHPMRRRGAGA